MSEDLSQAAESAEAAQSAVESVSSSPPPWGDDFNPERAWQTITHLRDREKELESDAKAFKRLQDDEDARRDLLSQWGYEIDEGQQEEEEELEEETPAPQLDPRVDALIAERAQEAFERDLTKFAGDREVSPQAHDWIESQTLKNGASPEALEKATKAWFEFEDGLTTKARESYLQSKQTPTRPPQPGKAGEAEFDRKAATSTQRRLNREARIAAALEAQQ